MSSLKGDDFGMPSFGGQSEDCQKSYKPISLLSPNQTVLNKLSVGSELAFASGEGEVSKSLFVLFQGETLGTITRYVPQITNCIDKGHTYIGIVLSVESGSCSIEARMES